MRRSHTGCSGRWRGESCCIAAVPRNAMSNGCGRCGQRARTRGSALRKRWWTGRDGTGRDGSRERAGELQTVLLVGSGH